jgi:type IV secretion system protein VirD4
VSESVHREALTPFHLLRQVRPGEAVLIHGTLPPAHLQARQYWEEPDLMKLTGPDPDDVVRRAVSVVDAAVQRW